MTFYPESMLQNTTNFTSTYHNGKKEWRLCTFKWKSETKNKKQYAKNNRLLSPLLYIFYQPLLPNSYLEFCSQEHESSKEITKGPKKNEISSGNLVTAKKAWRPFSTYYITLPHLPSSLSCMPFHHLLATIVNPRPVSHFQNTFRHTSIP